ncbi:MAG: ABC transporter permease [Thermoplasmata archaeon]|nr:ABC transporter permease [Thermoplasmata archaeon]
MSPADIIVTMAFLAAMLVAVSALTHRALARIGTRQILRRKASTALVVFGLMIGTTIISASFIIGDTMDTMVTSEVYEGYYEVDEILQSYDENRDLEYMDHATYTSLKEEILDIDNVEDVTGEVRGTAYVLDMTSSQAEPSIWIAGVNLTESSAFGEYYIDGKRVSLTFGPGEVYLDTNSAKSLDASSGDELVLHNKLGRQLHVTVKNIVDLEGMGNWMAGNQIIMDLGVAQTFFNVSDSVNTILVTNDGDYREGAEHCEQVAGEIDAILDSNDQYPELLISNKAESVENIQEQVSQFTDMFFVFGTFSILAGIMLIINIFVMFAEERKTEMGISRAIGMKRRQLRRTFLYEGACYAGISSAVGAIVGIIVAYLSLWFIRDMFQGSEGNEGIDLLQHFTYTQEHLLLSFAAGFLISIVTISIVTRRISRLNIVRALRDIPEPTPHRHDKRVFAMGLVMLALGGLLLAATIGGDLADPPLIGLSLVLFAAGVLGRRVVGDRISFTISAALLLFLWLFSDSIGLFSDKTGGMELFILSGVFSVTGGVMLVMFNSDILLRGINSLFGRHRSLSAVFKISISHPMRNKFRTGLTMAMFALIIFTMVVMSVMVSIFEVNIDRITEEQSGGFDIVAFSNRPVEDIADMIDANATLSGYDYQQIHGIEVGMIKLNTSGLQTSGPSIGRTMDDNYTLQTVYGVSDDFLANNGYSLSDRAQRFASDRDAWQALTTDPGLIIFDNTVSSTGGEEYGPSPMRPFTVDIGGTVQFHGTDGKMVEKEVIGFTDQYILPGAFMCNRSAEEDLGVYNKTLFLFKLGGEYDVESVARDIERELLPYGINTVAIAPQVEEGISSMRTFFTLFNAFLALGLFVGIAGLGIIMIRNVHERRLEIGMMRAIGFKRRMVRRAFIIEGSFITILGLAVGALNGIAIGHYLWRDGFKDMGYELSIPFWNIFLICLAAFTMTMLAAIPPARAASNVTPAEALRFE